MNKNLCVYTCITGDYDDLHEIAHPEKSVDYYCFTNNKNLKSNTWKIVHISNSNLNNHLLSRKIKMLGHPIINENYDTSVWMDASVIWQKNITDFVSTYLKNKPFASFKHHLRSSIQEEAIACLRLRKDTKKSIADTLNFLQAEQFPDNLGLYEMTVFIKKHHDPIVIKTMRIWFDMIQKYSKRDQLSFMYAVWRTGLPISPINLNVWNNPWFTTTKHNPNQETTECHVYYGNPNQDFDFDKYYIYQYKQNQNTYHFSTTIPYSIKEIEFNPTSVIGASYQNLKITPTPKSTTTEGITLSIFCNDHGTIRAYSDFTKGQKLSFSITIDNPTPATINRLIQHQWSQNTQLSNQLTQLQNENKWLRSSNQQLQTDLNNIINSRSWQTIQKARRIIRH